MTALEFIKMFGWLSALSVSNHFTGLFEFKAKDGEILFSFQVEELKQYVDAWKLVGSIGGLRFAKKFLEQTGSTMNNTLEKSIALVEEVESL